MRHEIKADSLGDERIGACDAIIAAAAPSRTANGRREEGSIRKNGLRSSIADSPAAEPLPIIHAP